MREEVRALFPEAVEGAELFDAERAEPLFPEEEARLARAVDKRRVEFALGRTCARRALAALGAPACALPSNPDRTVAWPTGFVGSITHADGYVAAVCARRGALRGLGIDAEVKTRVHDKLWRQIASDNEIAWIGAAGDAEARLRATQLFSAKEAFYKAQYCISQSWVGFHDAHFTLDDEGSFSIALTKDIEHLATKDTLYTGRLVVVGEHVISACVIV